MGFDFGSINYLAVGAAAIATFAVGGIWYGPLFSKPWMALTGVTEEMAAEGNMVRTFGLAFVMQVIAAFALAILIGGSGSLAGGAMTGFAVALVFVATSIAVNDLFEMRALKLWMINVGYNLVGYTLMGAIIGVWP